jgi:hypothetical protein
MNSSQTTYRSPMAWPAFILCLSSLCGSLWVTVHQTVPQGFLAHYGTVFLGVSMVAGTTANLLGPASPLKKWLLVLVWVCLVVSSAGLYLRAH